MPTDVSWGKGSMVKQEWEMLGQSLSAFFLQGFFKTHTLIHIGQSQNGDEKQSLFNFQASIFVLERLWHLSFLNNPTKAMRMKSGQLSATAPPNELLPLFDHLQWQAAHYLPWVPAEFKWLLWLVFSLHDAGSQVTNRVQSSAPFIKDKLSRLII